MRIFLGTEEAQYRAERVFFYSIEQVRDPARTYEIHLMKNVEGFNRRHWRTGFTNYRYAIPDFAGREGRAIYNDVDQIYLADPAPLFDLDMEGHGFLSIAASDTSVMLMDCARMWPMWNRAAASTGNKYSLLNKPKKTPGLWGALDPHWNARDQEYVEGRTKCLHYTALHQQPWEPFPEHYSYHPNPLAYVWHELERRADADGYQVFTRERPSSSFAAMIGSNAPRPPSRGASLPSAEARSFLAGLDARDALAISASGTLPRLAPAALGPQVEVRTAVLSSAPPAPLEAPADIVLLHDLVEHVPPADLGWLLDEAFAKARKAVHLSVDAMAFEGLGSAEWWQGRMAEAAARRPGVSWYLDAVGPQGGLQPQGVQRLAHPVGARTWALLTGAADDEGVGRLAAALGGTIERKTLAFRGTGLLPGWLAGASLRSLAAEASSPLVEPWPDVVISADPRAVPIARWIKAQAGGEVRLVQLGPPAASLRALDLVVVRPQDRLPIRDNVLQIAAPLPVASAAGTGGTLASGPAALEAIPRPRTAILVTGGNWPFVMPVQQSRELGRATAEALGGGEGAILVVPTRASSMAAAREVAGAAGPHTPIIEGTAGAPLAPADLLEQIDQVVVTSDDPDSLVRACLAERPVWLFDLPRWHDRVPALRPLARLGALLTGGGTTYRGTPHQQHAIGRLLDALAVRGLRLLPDDSRALQRSLMARGLVQRLGTPEIVAAPRPLDDIGRIVERVRRLLTERPAASGG